MIVLMKSIIIALVFPSLYRAEFDGDLRMAKIRNKKPPDVRRF